MRLDRMFFPTCVVLTWWSCCWWFLTMLASCGDVWRTIEYTVLPLQKAQVVLSKKSLVWHLDAWSGCALDYATKHLWIEFYRRPGTRQDSRNCLFSQFSWCLNVFKPWSQRERICRLSQFSGQVQDSQCSPLASACEGKYRYCVAPCYCLTMSEALRELSLQVQRTPCRW